MLLSVLKYELAGIALMTASSVALSRALKQNSEFYHVFMQNARNCMERALSLECAPGKRVQWIHYLC